MDNETKKNHDLTLRDWILVCLGLILIALSVIGATDETPIGTFLTYSLAYLFGVFYPFFFVFFLIFGIRLAYSRSAFPIKGHGLFWLGCIIVTLSLFAFGAYPILQGNPTLAFTSFSSVYADHFEAFSRHPFVVDDFRSLGGLGGGYLGLFLLAIFSGAWGAVGDVVFYSLFLILGIFFIVYKPLRNQIIEMKRRKASRVDYLSPYQALKQKPKKVKAPAPAPEAETPEQPKEEAPHQAPISGGFPTDWNREGDEGTEPKKEAPKASEPEEPKHPSAEPEEDTYSQGGFSSGTLPFTDLRSRHLTDEDVKNPSALHDDSLTAHSEAPQKNEDAYTLSPEEDERVSRQASVFKKNYDEDGNTVEVLREDPTEKETVRPDPLVSQAAKLNQTAPVPEAKPAAFSVEGNEETEGDAEDADRKEAEEQEMLATKYFELQRKKQQEEQEKAAAEEEAKKSKVMKYVSDTPKDYAYPLPTDALLEDRNDSDKIQANRDAAQEKARIINQVFKNFDIQAKAISFTIGASVTRFDIQTDPGVRSDKIVSLVDELQIALKGDKSVRIETVVEGKNTSGIEIGNAVPMAVPFREAFRVIEENTKDNLLLPIGKDINGKIVSFPLNDMPHLLVAGTTGSGKSVLVHCMIMTLIMRNYPSQLKLMLIDPKQVEFAKYNLEPHLFCPVISDANQAITALRKLCDEMDRRYKVLAQSGCVKMSEYRDKRKGHESTMEEIPDVVCIIDEFADLMQTGGDQVANYVQRISQKARAAGVYLIIATQRPSKDVIPMVIKSNIACRIGLSCSTRVDSQVVLDEPGAETLLGKGDLLFKCPGKKSLIRAQSPFISNKDMDTVLSYLKEKAGDPNYDPDFLDLEVKEDPDDGIPSSEDLYEQVKDFVMKTGIVSKSALMRNLSLTYTKADQFLGRLRQEGIVVMSGGKNVVVKRESMED